MKLPILVSLLSAAAAAAADTLTALGHSPGLNLTTAEAGNPLFDGWFADPEIRVYGDVFWIFATTSVLFKNQEHFDAWSSTDLVQWTKHPNILTDGTIPWIKHTMWAPASAKGRDGKYYLYFSSHNGVRSKKQPNAGLAVAVADKPEGPYRDALNGTRLLDHAIHGGNPMDPDVFTDDDGKRYLYFGGTKGNVGILNDDMISFQPINTSKSARGTDAEYFKSITPRPSKFEEGMKVFKRNGTYYMMWSENTYGSPNYRVAYGTSDSPLGPFSPKGVILKQDPAIAVATGHNSVLNIPGTDIWYIVYHRRPLHESNGDNRVVALDRMYFDADGDIEPVELLVKDNFGDGQLSPHLWQRRSGDWTIVTKDGDDEQQQLLRGSAAQALALIDSHFADLVYDADITLEDSGSEAGVTFRTAPSRNRKRPEAFNGYAVWLSAGAGEVFLGHQKGKRRVGMTVLNSSSDVHVEGGRKYHLRVEFKGTTASVYVNDMAAPVMTVTNGADTSGQNGLWVKNGSALFDNVSIRHP
ncbi:hypothetical protein INS49_008520 [Diaporthe citri]|uniref:uncharacterized protein n=1 Tax=Diaporthe citri TaxID=83186 RepID=UPI001C7FD177|nr:uncharacterized protein INS49_008520 [Diaporthe citri]KAG6363421.1 hypothetical protein INS49_008520 [Diaporthe citri]